MRRVVIFLGEKDIHPKDQKLYHRLERIYGKKIAIIRNLEQSGLPLHKDDLVLFCGHRRGKNNIHKISLFGLEKFESYKFIKKIYEHGVRNFAFISCRTKHAEDKIKEHIPADMKIFLNSGSDLSYFRIDHYEISKITELYLSGMGLENIFAYISADTAHLARFYHQGEFYYFDFCPPNSSKILRENFRSYFNLENTGEEIDMKDLVIKTMVEEFTEKANNISSQNFERFLTDSLLIGSLRKEQVESLVKSGAKLYGRYESVPMRDVIKKENLQGVANLLNVGYNIDHQDQSGKTALHYACDCGFAEIINFLLDKEARTDIKDDRGKFASDYADHFTLCKIKKEKRQQLCETGVDSIHTR